ncbi:hypothetical protein CIPAW_15G002000 [Carya illinoinensis]|uniref:Transmembrane protein n=1 Tax=Carya illinoinensis TaxID=32201 RepID=A0A8T1N641_CARIL|nr:hypothetical protein CIPAW_15G002000 [Carya illinoinensis]
MASSSFSSKSSNLRRNTLCLILVFLVINGSCTATRPGVTIMVDSTRTLKEKHRTAFQYHGQLSKIRTRSFVSDVKQIRRDDTLFKEPISCF